MVFLRNIPIQRKITVIVLLTCSVVLFVATGVAFSFQLVSYRQSFTRDLSMLADIIANNSTAALALRDKKAAEEVLTALKAKSCIVSAWIRLPDGSEFARFGMPANRDESGDLPGDGFRFAGSHLLQGKPIVLAKERIGTLYLRADYDTGYQKLLQLHMAILAGVLAVSLMLAYVLSARLQRFISGPILGLANTARMIAENKDYSVRAAKRDDDELGLFTDAFNQMLAQIQAQDADLQAAHHKLEGQVAALQYEIAERKRAEQQLAVLNKQLMEASRHAGMAEVATGVLHNVGNVLNSVNVSATLVRGRLRDSRLPNLGKVAALLREHESNLADFIATDPKGKMIPEYLVQLSGYLEEENSEVQRHMESVTKNVEHVKEIVGMQQNYAKVAGVQETLPVTCLLEDALQINAAALERHRIKVERDYADVPPITVDRHKLLQILVNLVRNAKYALDESGHEDRLLRLGVSRNGSSRLKITVSDNGIGINPQNLTRIFHHGFTTKKDGHGFGLHSGANAAKEMGGSLTAHSDGLGCGATFTLELPIGGNGKGNA